MPLPLTDIPPKDPRLRKIFESSDSQRTLPLPPPGVLLPGVGDLKGALEGAAAGDVGRAAREVTGRLCEFYGVPLPKVVVLGVRPRRITRGVLWETVWEIHGDYAPSTGRIRLWMRTAMRHRTVAFQTLLNTLLHEVCHHLDFTALSLGGSFHTRGFFDRVGRLYCLALGRDYRPSIWRPLLRGRYIMDLNAMKARDR